MTNFHIINTNKFHTKIICVLIRRPLCKEEATINALLVDVMKKGCKKYNSLQKINVQMEKMYGATLDCKVLKKEEEQILQFYIEYIKDDTESLNMLKEIIYNPLVEKNKFNEEIVNYGKTDLKNTIESKINDKTDYAKENFIKLMFESNYSVPEHGYINEVNNICEKHLYTHYKKVISSSKIEVICLGHFESQFIKDVKQTFINNENKKEIKEVTPLNSSEVKIKEDKLNIAQSQIVLGFTTNISYKSKEYISLLLFNEILGGSSNSKLFINVREKEALCYFIYSYILKGKGVIVVQSGVNKNDIQKAKTLIKEEIQNITFEEIQKYKETLIRGFLFIKDSNNQLINFYGSRIILEEEKDIDKIVQSIKEVTKEDLKNVLEKIKLNTEYVLGA